MKTPQQRAEEARTHLDWCERVETLARETCNNPYTFYDFSEKLAEATRNREEAQADSTSWANLL